MKVIFHDRLCRVPTWHKYDELQKALKGTDIEKGEWEDESQIL